MFAFIFSTILLLGQLDSGVSIADHRQINISQENAWIDKEGDARLNTLGVAGNPVTNSVLDITGSLSLKEQATADTETTDWGQVWVKNTDPVELWFTDDVGTNFNIGGASGDITGSGNEFTIPIWTSSNSLDDSALTQSGSDITTSGSFSVLGVTFAHTRNDIGGTVVSTTVNGDNSDGASSASLFVQTLPNGGDPFLHWNVLTAQHYAIGIDNSDSDKLVGVVGAVLGIDNWIEVDSSGNVVFPDGSDFTVEGLTNNSLLFADDSEDKLGLGTDTVTNTFLTIEGTVSLKEQTAADAFTEAYGQIWIKDDDPNTLWFTDDGDTDYQLGGVNGTFTTLTTSGDVGLGGAISTNSLVSIEGSVSLKEQADQDVETAGYGQIWVKNTSPNELWFTDDDGSDFILGGVLGSDISGTGTANKLAVFAGPQTISDSIIAEVAGDIGVNTVLPVSGFDIRNAVFTLSTSDTDIIATDILGQINFQAPDEASGTDALLAGASIWAEADASFSAAVNNTDLIFATAESETAVEKMRLTSDGNMILVGDIEINGGDITSDVATLKMHTSPATGAAVLALGARPLDNSSTSQVRFGRETNTSGTRLISIFKGDGTSTITAEIDMATGSMQLDGDLRVDSASVFNEGGGDNDFRVEGVGVASALFVRGSNGFVGIGTDTPGNLLTVNGQVGGFTLTESDSLNDAVNIIARTSHGELNILISGNVINTHLDGLGDQYLAANNGLVGIGLNNPSAKLHVLSDGVQSAGLFRKDIIAVTASVLEVIQDHTGAATSAVKIQQDDISEGFINFVGSDRGSVSGSVASVRVEINGTVYVIPMYADQ